MPATSPASTRKPSARAPGDQLREEQPFPPAREEREEQEEERPPDHQVVARSPRTTRRAPGAPCTRSETVVSIAVGPGAKNDRITTPSTETISRMTSVGRRALRCVARRREDPHVGMTQRSRVELGQAAAAPMGPEPARPASPSPKIPLAPAPPVAQASRWRPPRPFGAATSGELRFAGQRPRSIARRKGRCRDVDERTGRGPAGVISGRNAGARSKSRSIRWRSRSSWSTRRSASTRRRRPRTGRPVAQKRPWWKFWAKG